MKRETNENDAQVSVILLRVNTADGTRTLRFQKLATTGLRRQIIYTARIYVECGAKSTRQKTVCTVLTLSPPTPDVALHSAILV